MGDSISALDTKAEWLATYNELARSLSQRADSSRAGMLLARKSLAQDLMALRGLHIMASVRCNEFSPINALPVEILSMIFERLAWSHPHKSSKLHGSGWVSANRVCRKWYRVMADTANLWSTISFDGREPLGLFIPRSKQHPLCIAGKISSVRHQGIPRMVQLLRPECLPRLRELHLEAGDSYISGTQNVIPRLLLAEQTHAPQLEVLELESPLRERRPVLGHTFVSSRAPRLRRVVLQDYFFPWGAGSSSLRHLAVSFSRIDPDKPFPYTVDDILESLRAMPNLERLTFVNAIPLPAADSLRFIETRSVVPLPRLKHLSLETHDEGCWVLWALLEAHPSAYMFVDMFQPASTGILPVALRRHACRPDRTPYTILVLRHEAAALQVCYSNTHEPRDPGIKLYVAAEVPEQVMPHVLRSIPLESVEQLGMLGEFPDDMNDVSPLFAAATRLRDVVLRGTGPSRMFCTLLLPLDVLYDEPPPGVRVPLPSLADLRVAAADLKALPGADGYPAEPIGQRLGRALAIRKAAGHGLHRLFIANCAVEMMLMHFMCSVAKDVCWDEVQELQNESDTGDVAGEGQGEVAGQVDAA